MPDAPDGADVLAALAAARRSAEEAHPDDRELQAHFLWGFVTQLLEQTGLEG